VKMMASNQMKIPIPDWAKGKPITIMAGREPFLLYLPHTSKWYKKIKRCNICGKCCRNVGLKFPWRDKSGDCWFLKREVWNFPPYDRREVFICTNPYAPTSCIIRNPLSKPHPDCSIEYAEVK